MIANSTKGTCRKCWNSLRGSEDCDVCGESFARIHWPVLVIVLVTTVVIGRLVAG